MASSGRVWWVSLLVLLSCVAVAQRVAESGQAAAHDQANPESEYSLVETPSGPGLRFPVIHMHGMGRCYGYLTLAQDQVYYQVTSGEAQHSFTRARSELRETSKEPRFFGLGVRFKWNGSEDMVFVPVQEKTLNDRSAFKVRRQGRDEKNLLLAAQNFPTALAQLGSGTPQQHGNVAPSQEKRGGFNFPFKLGPVAKKPDAPSVAGATPFTSRANSLEAAAMLLSSRITVQPPSGIYDLEDALTFNVIDGAYFDAVAGQVTLFGHREPRYAGPRIPYLQHLAVLLENPRPEFTLNWTPESERRVKTFMERAESPEEARRLGREWGRVSNADKGDYRLTPQARYLFRGLNVMPTFSGSDQPGYFGAEVQDTPEAFGVMVVRVDPNGPAARAGVRVGDKITQAGPDGKLMITAHEFRRMVRMMGGGGVLKFVIERTGWTETVLGSLNEDVWSSLETHDFTPMLLRAAGKHQPALIIEAMYMGVRVAQTYPDTSRQYLRAYEESLYVLGIYNDAVRLSQEARAGRMSENEGVIQLHRITCAALERKMGFAAGSMTARYDAMLRQGARRDDAYHDACLAPENYLPLTSEALSIVWRKAGALQIAPELIDRTFNVRPEVVPEFRGIRPDTLLARAMFEADYIGKRMMDMPWLERKIPRYMTGHRFAQQNPRFDKDRGSYHMWISVAGMNAVQSPDKSTLEIRDAKMRFNIREYGPGGRDLPPQPGDYEELLTSLYDDLTLEFPVLHEIREAAKLAAIADWIRAKRPDFRLPQDGMARWSPPRSLPGLMYLYAYPPNAGDTAVDVTTIATGGVALEPWVWSGKANLDPDTLPVDSSVVDLRDLPAGAAPAGSGGAPTRTAVQIPRYDNQALSRVLNKKIEVPEYRAPGWIAPARKAQRMLQTISVLRDSSGAPGCDDVTFAQKLAQLERLQQRLAETEKIMNAVNARSPEMTALFDRLDSDLRRDKEQFEQQALDTASNLLFDVHHELKNGTLKQTAEGVAELTSLLSDVEGWKSRLQNLTGSESERMSEIRSIMVGLTQKLSDVEGTAAARYLGPVFKSVEKAEKLKDITELYFGLAKVFTISDWRGDQATQQAETDERIRRSILPLHRRLIDQITAVQNDPVISGCVASTTAPN